VSLLLGLSSALFWGTADFLGGTQAKLLAAVSVAFWSQLLGGLALLALVLLLQEDWRTAGVLWGASAGLCTGAALVLFYRGLATGQMALVAPISGCAAIVPLAVSVVRGEAPNAIEWAGIALALAGIVLVSRPVDDPGVTGASRRAALGIAFGAALGFGMYFVLVDKGVQAGASPLWVVAGARAGSITVITAIGVMGRGLARAGSALPLVALTGILDTAANALFAYATNHGNVGIVSVFGSLYPVATVALAAALTAERMTPLRLAGAALALGGVALVSAG
jgi:drug/metabolite transporter (DMT)-like permease